MRRLIIGSMRRGAGKTSVIVGLGQALGKKFGYLKPFGDRLLYRKKRLWDYDAALMTNIFHLEDNPEEMSIGFDHSKLRFMYDEDGTRQKLLEVVAHVERGRELVILEGGKDISYGVSVHLDSLSLAQHTGGALILVVSGDEGTILDDACFFKHRLSLAGIHFAGIIVNKVHDVEEFKTIHQGTLIDKGIPVLGTIPYAGELTHLSVAFLAECLFAKVIAGEGGLGREVRDIFVGAMSTDAAMRNPLFTKSGKLVITSGDRSDMILSALDGDTAGVVLTNNILPPANIISRATERNMPLLLVAADTYEVAKQTDDAERLLTKDDQGKIELLARLVRERVDLNSVLEA